MLTEKQVNEIKDHLEKAQNPLFFFDNDVDGLCAFLLLRRYFGRGKGVAVKSFPDLNLSYFRKINELKADYVFVLDKPIISKDFLKEIEKRNIPLVWIDHHEMDKREIPKFVHYYNPVFNSSEDKGSEPTTYLCYQVTRQAGKKDLWIAIAGCIADGYVPDFYLELKEVYPDLYFKSEKAFDILYNSELGRIIRILSFALKDRTTNVIKMIKFLSEASSPHDVLKENNKNYLMHKRFNQVNLKYQKLLKKAEETGFKSEKLLFFQYGGDLSISADLANELAYKFPNKTVVVAYIRGIKANISIRGKKIRKPSINAIKGLEDATAGGHEDATGAKIQVEDLEKFKENLMKEI